MTPIRGVLFVCTGNICRSPTADGVLRTLVGAAGLAGDVRVDSAGTHGYHVGEAPDARSQRHARARGYDLSGLRARRVTREDFERFDLVLAMDDGHLAILERMAPAGHAHKVRRFVDFATASGAREVPDPYYGGERGFEQVLDLIEEGARELVRVIERSRKGKGEARGGSPG